MKEVKEVRVRLDTQEIEEMLYEDKEVVWVHVEDENQEVRVTIVKEESWG